MRAMDKLLAILIAVSVATMSLQPAIVASFCECARSSMTVQAAGSGEQAAPACCGNDEGSKKSPSPDDNERPCDGSECPMACCTLAKTLATPVAPTASVPVPPTQANGRLAADSSAGSAHLERLQRPPRPVTTA